MTASHLPDRGKIGLLVEEFFNNIHPLRCFAFIHRPSFLQRLDKDGPKTYQSHALLHIISEWAKIAQRLILEALDTVTIEKLMASVLLHDHAVRMGNFANAFMLSGLITRMTQALQINLEYNTDVLCQNR
ncbi:hypothetical protein N7486_006170 [Penicillium sp. IBT 16267x]|nr:hypothetical protein N7486_006170 [Penicillium sp. IBT 16267x]